MREECNRFSPNMQIEHPPQMYQPNITRKIFEYVSGQYFLRIKECDDSTCNNDDCDDPDRCWCSQTVQFGEKRQNTCSNEEFTAHTVLKPETGSNATQKSVCEPSGNHACNFSFMASVPMCVPIQDYSKVNVSLIKVIVLILFEILFQ